MSNLVTQYIRRISKKFTGKDDLPIVAAPGTNHVDNADTWTDKTIYEGEEVLNVYTGKAYTSNGNEIVEIGAENCIVTGMQVVSIPGASNNADPLYIRITDGYVKINGKLYKHKAVVQSDNAPGDIAIQENNTLLPRFDLIYAYSGYPNTVEGAYKANIKIVSAGSILSNLYDNSFVSTKLIDNNLNADDAILLGILYVPPLYSSFSENKLRPWSWGVSSDGTGENLLNSIESQPFNIPSVTPGSLLNTIVSKVSTHYPSNGDLRKRFSYIKGQVLIVKDESSVDKKIYKVLSTHFCESIDTSVTYELITPIGSGSGSGGPGITDHSQLSNLEFDDAGHYGFQRKTITLPRDPNVNDCINPPVSFMKAESGTLWINTVSLESFICVNDTANNAQWVSAYATVREIEIDKDFACLNTTGDNQLAMSTGISQTPANGSYVKVEVNGVGVIVGDNVTTGCECYFSNDGGVTARKLIEIQADDLLYWNGTVAGYDLQDTFSISLYYLVGTDNAGGGGGGGGGGGDSALTHDVIANGVGPDLGIPDGTVVPAGTTFEEWLTGFYVRALHPTYYAPVFSISPNSTSMEAGSYVQPSIVPSFTQNDAGAISNYTLTRTLNAGTPVDLINAAAISTYNDSNTQITDGANRLYYAASLSYASGVIKNNNLGQPDPTGRIIANTLTDVLGYTGYRNAFYAADLGNTPLVTSATIRALGGIKTNVQNGSTFNISIASGATRISIAYPASLTNVHSIKYVELGNADVKDTFVLTSVFVEGANGYDPIEYKVYTYIPAVPFSSAATYAVTI